MLIGDSEATGTISALVFIFHSGCSTGWMTLGVRVYNQSDGAMSCFNWANILEAQLSM